MREAGTTDMFKFRQMSEEHDAFWDEMNTTEFDRGHVRGEYERSSTPALCEMHLLTEQEYKEWLARFQEFGKRH